MRFHKALWLFQLIQQFFSAVWGNMHPCFVWMGNEFRSSRNSSSPRPGCHQREQCWVWASETDLGCWNKTDALSTWVQKFMFLTHIQIPVLLCRFWEIVQKSYITSLDYLIFINSIIFIIIFYLEIDRWSHSILNCNAIFIYLFIFNWQMFLSWHIYNIESSCITWESNHDLDHHQQLNFILYLSNSS